MTHSDELTRENETLRDRLSRLSEAGRRINESLELDEVLQDVLDSARALTGAHYGVITLLDDTGRAADFLASGMTAEEAEGIWSVPNGLRFFEYLGGLAGPLRVESLTGHLRSQGLPELRLPVPAGPFLAAPIRHRGERSGYVYLANREQDDEFGPEDAETLVLFAAQAALVIANARRRRAEQRARADLEALVGTSPVGVVVFDARKGRVTSLNREARRIVGDLLEPESTVERALETLTFRRADGRSVSLEELTLAQALSAGETVWAEEVAMDLPDGRSVTALVNATPIRSEEGEVDSFVVTLQDMAPRDELERLRAEFLGMVSHELRTPLTSIRGSATALLEEGSALDPVETRQFHRIIVEQADRMRGLINDLLDAALIETGALAVSPEPSDTALLVEEAGNAFRAAGGRNGLEVDVPADLPRVMADRRRIVQALVNLLAYSARHSGESSAIHVSALEEGLHVAVSVAAQGRGIPAERLPHLFQRYARVDGDARGGDLDGSGLGLAICKGIVESHGGRITAESGGPGHGTRFTFTIPQEESTVAAGRPRTRRARPRRGAGRRPRVLVLDDDPQALRFVRDALSGAGYDPVVTADPEDVPGLVEEENPRLALMDLALPGADGIDLMRGVLERAGVPVIFFSSYDQQESIDRALDLGAADYLVKPFGPTELVARVRAALRRKDGPGPFSQPGPYRLGDLGIDYGERRVTVAGRPVDLTAIEYAVLFELSASAGLVLTHSQLLQRVWGKGPESDAGTVRTIVNRLRRKLSDDAADPTYIFTEPRVGFRMIKGEDTEEEEKTRESP